MFTVGCDDLFDVLSKAARSLFLEVPLAKVIAEIPAAASVMVVLDSDHSRDHVLTELRRYGPLVTEGCRNGGGTVSPGGFK